MKTVISKLTNGIIATLLCAAAVTTAVSQEKLDPVTLDAFAAKGKVLAEQDPLAIEFQDSLVEADSLRGFYIGMGVAEGHTAPGSGKNKTCASLPALQSAACALAVRFSVDRNKHADLYKRGMAIADADPSIALARNGRDGFDKLGFYIGLGSAEGHTEEGPGKEERCASLLSPASRTGCRNGVSLLVKRNRNNAALGATTETGSEPPQQAASNETKDGPLEIKRDQSRTREVFQPANTIKVSVRYKKELGYLGESNAFGDVGPTSCSAFSVSVVAGDGSIQQRIPSRITSDSKMEDTAGYYVCSYLVSEIPLDQPLRITVSMSGSNQFAAWKGGSQAQPLPGQQRTIIIVSGRVEDPIMLTATRPRARKMFEMIYTTQPR